MAGSQLSLVCLRSSDLFCIETNSKTGRLTQISWTSSLTGALQGTAGPFPDISYSSELWHLYMTLRGGDITECESETNEPVKGIKNRQTPVSLLSVCIEEVEVVTDYKHLGVCLDRGACSDSSLSGEPQEIPSLKGTRGLTLKLDQELLTTITLPQPHIRLFIYFWLLLFISFSLLNYFICGMCKNVRLLFEDQPLEGNVNHLN